MACYCRDFDSGACRAGSAAEAWLPRYQRGDTGLTPSELEDMIESTAASIADAAPIVRPSSSRYPPSNTNADGLDTGSRTGYRWQKLSDFCNARWPALLEVCKIPSRVMLDFGDEASNSMDEAGYDAWMQWMTGVWRRSTIPLRRVLFQLRTPAYHALRWPTWRHLQQG